MNTKPLFLSIALVLSPFAMTSTQADILAIGPHAKVMKKANMPKHGDAMRVVTQKFGQARAVKTSKGKITKHNPKITRWDYVGFSVYFENSHVIHSVIHR